MLRDKSSVIAVVVLGGIALFFNACGKGGSNSSTNNNSGTPPPDPKTPTVSLSVLPQSITAGQSATLTWTSTDATSVTITPTIGSQAANDPAFVVTPSATTTYTATATGS